MCEPLTIAALAASAAATGAGVVKQKKAADRSDKRKAALITAESERQRKLGEESKSKALESLGSFERGSLDEAEKQNIERNLTNVAVLKEEGAPTASFQAGTTPKIIKDAFARSQGEADASSSKFAQALAKVAGSGQALQGANIKAAGNQSLINILGNAQKRSAGLLPSEVATADTLKNSPIGDLLSGLGQAGLTAAIGGGFEGGSATDKILGSTGKKLLKTGKSAATPSGLDISKIINLA